MRLVQTWSGIKARLREEVHKTVPVHYANSCTAALSEKARGDCLIQSCSFFYATTQPRSRGLSLPLQRDPGNEVDDNIESKKVLFFVFFQPASETSLAVFSVFTKCLFSWANVSRR